MVILSAFRVFTFDTGATFGLLAYKAFMFVAFFINVFDSPNINDTILFLKVALRHPD
jgi:hypothetical protein